MKTEFVVNEMTTAMQDSVVPLRRCRSYWSRSIARLPETQSLINFPANQTGILCSEDGALQSEKSVFDFWLCYRFPVGESLTSCCASVLHP